jgi:Cdc6-like AAA superfamily ATPase
VGAAEIVVHEVERHGMAVILDLLAERGVGKTSLANLLYDILVLSGRSTYQRARINCAESMNFDAIWSTIFRQLKTNVEGEEVHLGDSVPAGATSENIRECFDTMDDPSIVIIDEFDRVQEQDTQTLMADTIKTLSDNSVNTTLVLVGVADSIDQLISEHRSIDRALVQIQMQRMSKAELVEIIDKCIARCSDLSVDIEVKMGIEI